LPPQAVLNGNQDFARIAGKRLSMTPVDGRLPPQAVFGPAFMPGSRGAPPRPEAR